MTQPRSTDDRGTKRSTWGGPFLKGRTVAGVIIAITAVFGSYLYVSNGDHWVETQLLFFDSNAVLEGDLAVKSSLERELEMLKSPAVVFLTAREVFSNGKLSQYRGAPEMGTRLVSTTGSQNEGAFVRWAKWLAEARAVRSAMSGGVMTVTVRMNGPDREVLKPVVEAYVDSYIKHRHRLAHARADEKELNHGPTQNRDQKLTDEMNRQLHRIDWQIRRCELALERMNSRRGAFSGFIPDGETTGISVMQRFQDRIVQLEIDRAKLGVQFKPGGREIRSVDCQIAAVKKAMRQCLREHLQFFQKGRAELQAKLARQQRIRQSRDTVEKPAPPRKCRGTLPGGDGWFLIDDGLYMIRDKSFFRDKPLPDRVRAYQTALFASLKSVIQRSVGPDQPTASHMRSPDRRVSMHVCRETDGEQGSDRRDESGDRQ